VTWSVAIAGMLFVLAMPVGVVLTLVTLPGVWVLMALAVGVQVLWMPELFSWWTLAACFVLAAAGEVAEAVATGVGAAKGGASKWGIAGAIVGTLVGAVLGTFIPLPIIGTLIGAALGAAAGAVLAEKVIKNRGWMDSTKAGAGAAAGRLVALVVKGCVTAAVGVTLAVAAFVG
jgi:uncharacterized protein YqgC (DUF456 family)